MRYFAHDTDASNDEKVQALRLEHGGAAVDAYWTIVEQIYREETPLVFFGNRLGSNSLSHRLCTDPETLEKWVLTMVELGLLERCGEGGSALFSERMEQGIASYRKKAETARENGKRGGRKPRAKTKAKPTSKPTGNRAGSESLSESKANKTVGFHKENLTVRDDDAASCGASSSLPCCPLCGTVLSLDTASGGFRCPDCGDTFAAGKIKYRQIGEELE